MAYDSYTKLLLHFNGTDGSTTITDEIGKTVTVSGSTQIDTAQYKFGGASCLFGTTSSDNISLADSDDWNFGTGDFTIDFWIRLKGVTNCDIFDQRTDGNNQMYAYYDQDEGIIFRIVSSGSNLIDLTNPKENWNTNEWIHVAIVRYGSNFTMYRNGTALKTATGSITYPNYTGSFRIGKGDITSTSTNGWIDEFRVSKGIARWTTNFTPPTGEYGPEATINYLKQYRRTRFPGSITGL